MRGTPASRSQIRRPQPPACRQVRRRSGSEPKDRPSARAAARVSLVEIEQRGARSDIVLEETLASFHLPERDLHLLKEIVLGVLRQRAYLDWVLERAGSVSMSQISPDIRQVLRISAYQILFLDRVPDHAAVDEAVEDAKRVEGTRAAGFVNAILRKITTDRETIRSRRPEGNTIQRLAIETSHPVWLVRRWQSSWGKALALKRLGADNEVPPVTLRVNRLKTDREHLLQLFTDAGITARPTSFSAVGITVEKSGSPTRFPGFAEGLFYVQDEAAQLVGFIVGARPGERMLDVCAAPGGKTLHLAEQMDGKGEITAVDSNPDRLRRLRENAERMGATMIRFEAADAARGLHFADRRGFDRALVDAPCTALGTLRRHPEAKWFKGEGSIGEAASLQMKILSGAAPWVKPGGELVYSTCTTEPEENEEVVRRFLERFSEFTPADPAERLGSAAACFVDADGFFRTFQNDQGMDGFFAARWIKRRRT